jgi:prepilin-type processing-associated H-X9-DG protein
MQQSKVLRRVIGLFLVIVVALRFLPPMIRKGPYSQSCPSNLKQIGWAFMIYSQDYNGRFPPAQIGGLTTDPSQYGDTPVGWADALHQNMMNTPYHCREGPNPNIYAWSKIRPPQSGYTDYWFNGNLSAVRRTDLAHPQATLLAGEGNDGTEVTNATYSKTNLPPLWLVDANKPPSRHGEGLIWHRVNGANYLYADGHVSWLEPDQVVSNFGRANCFSIK